MEFVLVPLDLVEMDSINYKLGDTVYLKTDIDQYERIITAICLRIGNIKTYELAFGENTSWHYDIEMTIEKNVLKKL